jgi:hypothetical protein
LWSTVWFQFVRGKEHRKKERNKQKIKERSKYRRKEIHEMEARMKYTKEKRKR